MTENETETVEPLEDVEEVNPLTVIASLERDLEIAQAALRKILRINPSLFDGGDTNKYFGRRHEQAFGHAQAKAFEALSRMENHVDKDN